MFGDCYPVIVLFDNITALVFLTWVSSTRQINNGKREEPHQNLSTPPLRCSSRGQSINSQHSSGPLVSVCFSVSHCSCCVVLILPGRERAGVLHVQYSSIQYSQYCPHAVADRISGCGNDPWGALGARDKHPVSCWKHNIGLLCRPPHLPGLPLWPEEPVGRP